MYRCTLRREESRYIYLYGYLNRDLYNAAIESVPTLENFHQMELCFPTKRTNDKSEK